MIDDFERSLMSAVDAEASREDRAHVCAELVGSARGYRWVNIYDVDDDAISLLGWTGATPPVGRFALDRGLNGEAVRTRETVTRGAEVVVPILGAESGIVIGTLEAHSERTDTDGDVAFLERCAAILRPLYD